MTVLNTYEYTNKIIKCINNVNNVEVRKNQLTQINKKVIKLVNKSSRPDDMKILVKINKLALIITIVDRLKYHKVGIPIRQIVTKC